MAEYPARSCGKCPFLGKYEAITKDQGDFLARKTIPEPKVQLQSKTTLHEDLIGVSSTFHAPKLSVSPIPEEGTQSTQQLGVVGAKHTPYNVGPGQPGSRSALNIPQPPQNVRVVKSGYVNATPSKAGVPHKGLSFPEGFPCKDHKDKCCCPCITCLPTVKTGEERALPSSACCCDTGPQAVSARSPEDCPPSPYNLEKPCNDKGSRVNLNVFDGTVSQQQLGVVGAKHTPYSGGIPVDNNNVPSQANQFAARLHGAGDPHGAGHQPGQPNISESQAALKGILKNKNEGQVPCPCENMAYTAGRQHPDQVDPSAQVPVPNDLRPVPQQGREACYLPQPEDKIPVDPEKNTMGPIGPWATGRLDWSPLAGLTGTRPVVDKYSIARFSEGEWRAHNKEMLDMASREQHKANLVEWNGRQCLEQTRSDIDKNQEDNTKRLLQRSQDVHRWKCELERAIAAAAEEIEVMEEQRRRLKSASSVLMLPEAIAGECLERRTGRLDPELVRDIVEEELIKELALTAELRETFYRTLKDVEAQLLEDKTAKQRLEIDWSDKKEAHEIESINVALNNKSTVLLFKPGATIFPDEQSSEEYWEHFTRETLKEAEATRQRSVALRGTLDAILLNAARDLRAQADKVDMALSKRIACTEEIRIRLENDLKKILQRLADVEDTLKAIRIAIRNMDTPMKKAQTRLDNRLQRKRVENCRDQAHFGLVEEVKLIADNVSALGAQFKQAEESQASLMKARSDLEREIMVKRKTLEIDRDRTQLIRSHYPSAAALSGYA